MKKKQHGEKIKVPERRETGKVVNLMDTRRASAKGESARRAPARTHARAAKKAGRTTVRHRKAS